MSQLSTSTPIDTVPTFTGPANGLAHRHWHRFEGSFNVSNVFKGAPRPELDAAWDRFTNGSTFSPHMIY